MVLNIGDVTNWKQMLNKVVCGDAMKVLKSIPDDTVDMIVTSPPYFAQRNNLDMVSIWDEKDDCNHDWSDVRIMKPKGGTHGNGTVGVNNHDYVNMRGYDILSCFCTKCGAWKGQFGLEPIAELYVKHLCDVFKEAKRVLKPSGSCWVILDDTYGGSGTGQQDTGKLGYSPDAMAQIPNRPTLDAPAKSLMLIPARFSIGMYDQGWLFRNIPIWYKDNAMPENQDDRFTNDYEFLFFMTKNEHYYFNKQYEYCIGSCHRRIKRTVWRMPTVPLKIKGKRHCSTYPETLIDLPINACCPPDGIVLDMFAGLCTTAIVAERLERKWICSDLCMDYCSDAEKRISKTRQTKLTMESTLDGF